MNEAIGSRGMYLGGSRVSNVQLRSEGERREKKYEWGCRSG